MTRSRWVMLLLFLGGCASPDSRQAKTVGTATQPPRQRIPHRRWYPPQQPQTSNARAWRLVVALALALLAAVAPSGAQAKPSRSLRIAMDRAPGSGWLRRLNQSSNVGVNTGPQGRRNAVYDQSRAVQGPPNSYGFLPNTGD